MFYLTLIGVFLPFGGYFTSFYLSTCTVFADILVLFTFALFLFVGFLFRFDGILPVSVSILDIFHCIPVCGHYALSDSVVSVFCGLFASFCGIVDVFLFDFSCFCGHFPSF